MNLFYCENVESKIIALNSEESLHCAKVLRAKNGDAINVTNGNGILCRGTIIEANQRKTLVEVNEKIFVENQNKYKLHIAIAPTKSMERFEWFVEKAVEVGIERITPIICRYSERKVLKNQRVEKIALSAMKQSLRYHKPVIEPAIEFDEFIKKSFSAQKYIAYCKTEQMLKNVEIEADTLFLIGPEGGFADFEHQNAVDAGFLPVKIANNRLRTETAGVFIASAVAFASNL